MQAFSVIRGMESTLKNFIETLATATSELKWLVGKCQVVKEYEDCVEKRFDGKLNYTMVMKIIKKNAWGAISEGGKGAGQWWLAQSTNAGLTFYPKTGMVNFNFYEAKQNTTT